MTAINSSEKVLDHIRRRGPSKAKQIADALGVERTVRNRAAENSGSARSRRGGRPKTALQFEFNLASRLEAQQHAYTGRRTGRAILSRLSMRQTLSVEFSMFAIAASRYEVLRADPVAIKNEVILRGALRHLAVMSFFKQTASEAEVLAEIRTNRPPGEGRIKMAEFYAREDTLVEAALTRGDREGAFKLGTNWRFIEDIMAGGEQPQWATRFFHHAPKFGENVGYGPAGLHDPVTVAAFAAYLELWTPERFAAAAELRANPKRKDWPGMTAELEAQLARIDAELFRNFKTYILAAAAARAGMLVWMN